MENQPTNPVKAIRAKCLECSCGSINEVEKCPVEKCPLYPFRFGKNPFRTQKEPSEAQKAARAKGAERLRSMHGDNSACGG